MHTLNMLWSDIITGIRLIKKEYLPLGMKIVFNVLGFLFEIPDLH